MKKMQLNYKIHFYNLEDAKKYSNYLVDKFQGKLFLNMQFDMKEDIWEIYFKIEVSDICERPELMGIWCDITSNELKGLLNEEVRQFSQVYVTPQYFGVSFINS